MTTGQQIIDNFDEVVNNQDPSLMKKVQVTAAKASMQIHDLHARAIACHCECMGMMSENMLSAVGNYLPPFGHAQFDNAMQKWGLVDENNQPII